MELKGTRTEENLLAAFQGESMARNKYLFFAEKARLENHPEISELFEKLATNEGMHGKLLFQALKGIGSTTENLQAAARGEYDEWSSMYPSFADIAEEEGFADIAKLFRSIAKIEQEHEFQFMSALAKTLRKEQSNAKAPVAPPSTPAKPKATLSTGYRCVFCGAIYEKRPDVCGLCHAIGSFEQTAYQKPL